MVKLNNVLSVDVEDWFHILDSSAVPPITLWPDFPLRAERSVEKILELLDQTGTHGTFFWLGWMAEQFPALVRKCQAAGHEVASHGFGHVLAYETGREQFRDDLVHAKAILEDITGEPVRGFRAPGFGITEKVPWAFEVIKETGHQYDSSVFPAARGHGGLSGSPIGPYFIKTRAGTLPEIPMSVVEIFGWRVSLFGGGYLRLAPRKMIHWGIKRLHKVNQPVVVYVHPREVDPDQPRLPLSLVRRFKCFVNLKTTMPKLRWLCENFEFCTMRDMVKNYEQSFLCDNRHTIPIVNLTGDAIGID